MSNFQIHEFHPQIYPRRLWVAKGGTFEDIKVLFKAIDGNELIEAQDCLATTYVVETKDEKRLLGHLIWFPSVKDMTADNMVHEAVHASMDMFGLVGCLMDVENQEPFAYLVGWVVRCLEEVKRSKAEWI